MVQRLRGVHRVVWSVDSQFSSGRVLLLAVQVLLVGDRSSAGQEISAGDRIQRAPPVQGFRDAKA